MGRIQHLALVDPVGHRAARLRHEEASQHRRGPRRRGEGLQGRHEGRRARSSPPGRSPRSGATIEGEIEGKAEELTRAGARVAAQCPRPALRPRDSAMFDIGFSETPRDRHRGAGRDRPRAPAQGGAHARRALRPPAALRDPGEGRHQPRDGDVRPRLDEDRVRERRALVALRDRGAAQPKPSAPCARRRLPSSTTSRESPRRPGAAPQPPVAPSPQLELGIEEPAPATRDAPPA